MDQLLKFMGLFYLFMWGRISQMPIWLLKYFVKGYREEYLRPDAPSYIQPLPGYSAPPNNTPKFSNEQLM
jgi:hypothetical protein